MRTIRVLFLGILFLLPTFLFAGGAAEQALEEEDQVLRIASWGIQEEGTSAYFRQLGEAFEAENPGVRIEWIGYPFGNLREQVLISASAGDSPDLVQTARGWFSTFATSGYFQSVEGLVSQSYLNDLHPALREDMVFNDETYAVPWFYSPFVMYYNTDLFEQAGLDPDSPPTTLEEAYEAAERISELTDDDGNPIHGLGITTASVPVSGGSLLSYIMSYGGNVWDDDDGGSIAIDSDEVIAALTSLQMLHESGINPEGAFLRDLRNLFATGQLGMYFDQLWGIAGVLAIDPNALDYAAVSPPIGGGGAPGASTMEAHLLMIPADARHPEIAAQFIEFATSEEQIDRYLEVNPFLTARESLAGLPTQHYEFLQALAGAADSVRSIPKHERMEDILLELTTMAQRVTVGGETPQQAARAMNEWLIRETQ